MENELKLLSVKEASELLGTTESFIRRAVFRKEIPFLKVGKKLIRFNKAELLAWVRRGVSDD